MLIILKIIYFTVEESVSTLPDSHQIKKSTDFIEQLKYLLDSSKKCTSTINDKVRY